jgi:NitT/TauT family transport system ATP-binding protein
MVANPSVVFGGEAQHVTPVAAERPSDRLLSVDRVNLEYRTRERIVRATHDVSFDVYGGDRFVLLGPSGCGKSTLLKAVAGFIRPTSGTIELDSEPIRGPGADRIVVFQEFDQLPPWKTVLQNIAFPLRVAKKMGRAQAN